MTEPFSLGARLQKCASFVKPSARLADIGTDHGYLPVWLIKTGVISSAIAADINEEPLNSAVKTGERYGVSLNTVLSDGFEKIEPNSIDTAVIAGMGGELIAKIISKTPWLKNNEVTLILQPMTTATRLREFLYENGFNIVAEQVVVEAGKIYSVIKACFAGGIVSKSPYMGAIVNGEEHSNLYAKYVVKGLKNKSKGLFGKELNAINEIIFNIEQEYLQNEKSL